MKRLSMNIFSYNFLVNQKKNFKHMILNITKKKGDYFFYI